MLSPVSLSTPYHFVIAVWRVNHNPGVEASAFYRSMTHKRTPEIFYGPFYGRAKF